MPEDLFGCPSRPRSGLDRSRPVAGSGGAATVEVCALWLSLLLLGC